MMIGSHTLPTAFSLPPRSAMIVPTVASSWNTTTPGAIVREAPFLMRSWPRTR
jgi:hypothetical protein